MSINLNRVICFHNPDEENGYLSNWYKSDFILYNNQYSSIEQYMMHQKALLFDDVKTAELILKENAPSEIKALGRQVKNYNDRIWNGYRQQIVYEGLYAKFSQNPHLLKQLQVTGKSLLAECAVKDRIWGIDLSMSDNRWFDIEQWKGQNLLGFSLMKVRDQLLLKGTFAE